MLINFTNGWPFATGATAYRIPQQGSDASRITITLEIEENLTEAIVDTGAPYVVCSPDLAKLFDLQPERLLGTKRLLIRGVWIEGNLYRINLSFLAEEGESLLMEAPAFIPDPNQQFEEGFLPRSFLGLLGCLESMKFGIDPFTDTFYFG
jgi:hypothetical protein